MRVLAGVVVVSLAPVILAQGITRTDLVATDLKYSQSQDVLYLAVPSISPHAPNSVLLADPVTGKDRGQIGVGIDPRMLALSDDEKYLYVWLAGESVIRRFNLATQKSDIQFPAALIGGSPQSTVASMLVPQGNPDAVIVFFRSTCCTPSDAGAAVFQNGQQLPDFIAPASIGCPGATYGASPDTLWCQDSDDTGSGFFQLHLDAQGIHAPDPAIYLVGTDFYQIPTFYQNRLFNNTLGSVVDPVRKILLALPGFVGFAIGGFAVDPSAAVVYYSRANDAGQPLMIAMDAQKYIPVAATVVSAVLSPMVRCGAGGLAGINESYGLTIIPLSSVPALPAPPPGVPATGSNGITRLQMPNGCLFYCQDEMIYDAGSNRLFVAVPDNVAGVGNSVVPIDASTFIPQAPIWVGDEPASLAIAPDGHHLLIGFHGTNQIRRLDLTTSNLDLDTTINSTSSGGLPGFTNGVIPLSPSGDSVATELVGIDAVEGYAIGGGVIASYTQGQLTAAATSGGSIVIAENGAGTALFGLGPGVESGEALNAHPLPLSASSSAPNSGGSIVGYLTCRQDTCLDSFGTVFDSAHNRVLGVCPTYGDFNSPLLDLDNQRAYFMHGSSQNGVIFSCDLNRFLPLENFEFADPVAGVNAFVSLGPDRFALNTGNEILAVPKSLLQPVPPAPTPVPVPGPGRVTLPLVTQRATYDPKRNLLYVSLVLPPLYQTPFPDAIPLANCIGVIDVSTGSLTTQIPLPGEPAMSAISSDAAFLYVVLNHSNQVARIDLASRTVSQIFAGGTFTISAIAAFPDAPSSIVVADQNSLRIFDNGVERQGSYVVTGKLGIASLVFGSASTQLYSNSGEQLSSWKIGATGITLILQAPDGGNPDIQYITRIGNRLFSDDGLVFDTATLAQVDTIGYGNLTADPASNRIYGFGAAPPGLSVIDPASEVPYANVSGATGGIIIPCGPQSAAILAPDRIAIYAVGTNLVSHLPGSFTPDLDGLTRANVSANAMTWDAVANRLVLTLSPAAGPDGNSVASLDPVTGKLSILGHTANQPGPISIAPDARVAYVGLRGPMTIARFNLNSGATERSWNVPLTRDNFPYPSGVFAISAATDTLALTSAPANLQSSFRILMAMDNGIARHDVVGAFPSMLQSEVVATTADRKELYTAYSQQFVFGVSPAGIENRPVSIGPGVRPWASAAACGGNLYLDSAQVIDSSGQLLSNFDPPPPPYYGDKVACDSASDKVLFLLGGPNTYQLIGYQLSTGSSLGILRFGNLNGNPVDMIIAGPSRAAIRTDTGIVIILVDLTSLGTLQPPSISAVSNAASYSQSGFAPGSIISIAGSGLASWTALSSSSVLPTSLADVSVRIGSFSAYLLYASDTQINAEISGFLPPGNTSLTVTNFVGATTTTIPIVLNAPGIFTSGDGHAQAQNQDYSPNSATNPAPAGSAITVYFTGQGEVTRFVPDGTSSASADPTFNPTTATLGGQPAAVTYSGLAPGLVGVAQANITVPDLPAGDYPLVITIRGAPSNSATISVQ